MRNYVIYLLLLSLLFYPVDVIYYVINVMLI